MHDMPSGHVRHLSHLGHLRHLRHWMYSGMPSSPYVILGHPGHLSHLSHLSNIGDLNTLDPYRPNPTPTDSQLGAFITEMDPTDPGLLEGCDTDNLLDPIPMDTPSLLPCLERHYTHQNHGQVLGTSDFPQIALEGQPLDNPLYVTGLEAV
jgi:hypothetical protein